jgi:hypothetical protein
MVSSENGGSDESGKWTRVWVAVVCSGPGTLRGRTRGKGTRMYINTERRQVVTRQAVSPNVVAHGTRVSVGSELVHTLAAGSGYQEERRETGIEP